MVYGYFYQIDYKSLYVRGAATSIIKHYIFVSEIINDISKNALFFRNI